MKTPTTRATGVTIPSVAVLTMSICLAASPLAQAFDALSSPSSAETSAFDAWWSHFVLYRNADNPWLQEFKLRGRYHGQYHLSDADSGNESSWEDRRIRFGFDAALLDRQVDLRVDFQSADEFSPVYDRLVDAYLRWHVTPRFQITAGRTKPLIGYYDFVQSTNQQPTFERSQIFNQLRVDRSTALTFEGQVDSWTWQLGAYSNDTDREFGSFQGGYSYGAGIGYQAARNFGWQRADFRLDWLHSDHDADDQLFTRYDDILSATFWGQQGRWGIVLESFFADGDNADQVAGFFLQPTYDLIPKRLQLVGRYSFAAGDGPDSVFRQTRYESILPGLTDQGRGDEYHALYLGAQYFIHGDKLKLMSGVEYAHLNGGGDGGDLESVTWLNGVRFSF